MMVALVIPLVGMRNSRSLRTAVSATGMIGGCHD